MKLPADVNAAELVKALRRTFGYTLVRQEGSHVRLTTPQEGEHHLTVPNHRPIKRGTLHGILKQVAAHRRASVEEVLDALDL